MEDEICRGNQGAPTFCLYEAQMAGSLGPHHGIQYTHAAYSMDEPCTLISIIAAFMQLIHKINCVGEHVYSKSHGFSHVQCGHGDPG